MFGRKYFLLIAVFALMFAGVMELSVFLIRTLEAEGALRVCLALLPALPLLVFGFRLEWQLYQRFDELQKQMHLVALMIGSGVLVVYCAAGVLIEYIAGMEPLPLIGALFAHGLSYYVALLVLRRFYQ